MIISENQRSTCPLSNGLDILGDKWTLLVIRDLMFTNRCEFGHFLQARESISTNILAERLDRLQRYGLVVKTAHPSHGKKFIYSLTDEAIKLAPTIFEFILWANSFLGDTYAPPILINMIKNKRGELIKLIEKRIPLIELEL